MKSVIETKTKIEIATNTPDIENQIQMVEIVRPNENTMPVTPLPEIQQDLTQNNDLKRAGESVKYFLWMMAAGAIMGVGVSRARSEEGQYDKAYAEIGTLSAAGITILWEVLFSPPGTNAMVAAMIKYPCQTAEIAVTSWDSFVERETARRLSLEIPRAPVLAGIGS